MAHRYRWYDGTGRCPPDGLTPGALGRVLAAQLVLGELERHLGIRLGVQELGSESGSSASSGSTSTGRSSSGH